MHTTTKIVLAGVLMGSSVLSAAIRLRLWRANLERLSAGLHRAGRQLCAVSRTHRRLHPVEQFSYRPGAPPGADSAPAE